MGDFDNLGVDEYVGKGEQTFEGGFEPLPEGGYIVAISEAEKKTSKAGNDMLSLRYEVQKGEHEGRLVFENLNMWHPNQKAATIAKKRFGAICDAIGGMPQKAESMIGKRLAVFLTLKKDKEGNMRNEVKQYSACKKATTQQAPAPKQTEETDDDMPF